MNKLDESLDRVDATLDLVQQTINGLRDDRDKLIEALSDVIELMFDQSASWIKTPVFQTAIHLLAELGVDGLGELQLDIEDEEAIEGVF